MKKLFTTMLTLLAISGTAFTANAQEEEPYFRCYVNGVEVKDGDRIDITQYLETYEVSDMGGIKSIEYNTKMTLVAEADIELFGTVDFVKNETPLTADGLYGADMNVQFCGFGSCYSAFVGEGPVGNPEGYSPTVGDEVNMRTELMINSEWDSKNYKNIFKYGSAAPLNELEIKAEFTMKITGEDQVMNLTFFVGQKGVSAGVEGIEADSNAPAVYYDLQGRRIDNPSNGLFIVKKGSKVSKQFIR